MNALLAILFHLWGAPRWLWGLLVLPMMVAVFLFAQWQRRRLRARLGNAHLIARLAEGTSEAMRWVRVSLLCAAVGWAMLAAARPQWGTKMQIVRSHGRDIVILLDVSLSMLAQDIPPNRLAAAKQEIASFLDRLTTDRVALVPFAGTAFIQCPLTADYSAVKLFLDGISTRTVPEEGTAIGSAIRVGLRAFVEGEDRQRTMILISDGEDHRSDPFGAAAQAKEHGVRIYTIGIGSPDGELIPLQQPDGQVAFLRDARGQLVKTRLDEHVLRRIAAETSGAYSPSTPEGKELSQIFDEIDKLEGGRYEEERYTARVDRYQWPLGVAVALLLLVPFIPDRREVSR